MDGQFHVVCPIVKKMERIRLWGGTLTNFVLPADTAALFCLSFTNARVVSTIILFRCGRMTPTHSKRLGLKHATVYFCNTMISNTQYVRVRSRVRLTKYYCIYVCINYCRGEMHGQ